MGNSTDVRVSFVIPVLNSERTLGECLDAILAQDVPRATYEIVIADAGSSDRTLEIARAKGVDAICENPLKTGEAGKAAGIARARGELIALVDSDNILPARDWLRKMLAPFDDPEIFATEPLHYGSRPQDPALTRYFADLGMNDPVCLFVGNYDRHSVVTGRWTDLDVSVEKRDGYLKLRIRDQMPTIGANGFIFRRTILEKVAWQPYFFDIDVAAEAVVRGCGAIAKVETSIVHLYCARFGDFVRKQRRRIRDFLYFAGESVAKPCDSGRAGVPPPAADGDGTPSLPGFATASGKQGRTYPWKEQKKRGIVFFILACVTVVPLLVQALRFACRAPRGDKRLALWHLPVCWTTLWIYGWAVVAKLFGRTAPADRSKWQAAAAVALLACAVFGREITETADFLAGTGTNGWTQTASGWQSPARRGTALRVSVTCTNPVSDIVIHPLGDNAFSVTGQPESFTLVREDPQLAAPADLWVTNITASGFRALVTPVSDAVGYVWTVCTNAVSGASAGTEAWRETFDKMETSTGTSLLTPEKLQNTDWHAWGDVNYAYVSSVAGTIRLGQAKGIGGSVTADISTSGEWLRIRTLQAGNAEGQQLRVARIANAETQELATVAVPAETFIPVWTSGRLLLESVPASASKDARVLIDDVAVVNGYASGTVTRVVGFCVTNAVPWLQMEDLPSVPTWVSVLARAAAAENDSERVTSEKIDLAYPPPMPMLRAVPIVEKPYAYAEDFSALASVSQKTTWYNGVTVPYWQAYRDGASVGEIGYGNANSQNAGLYAAGAALGILPSGDVTMSEAVIFENRTDKILSAAEVSFTAVQWGFRNTAEMSVTAEYCLADDLHDPTDADAWQSVPDLNMTGVVSSEKQPLQTARQAVIGGLTWRPGTYLYLRWTAPAAANSPGLGVSGFSATFQPKTVGLVLTVR